MDLFKDFWGFLGIRKKYWLPPIILALLLVGGLLLFGSGPAVAPFIYPLF
ncbi:MAG: hypothetical protein KKA60_07755 [Proteobacteria bacterium]|nr:hypothetical protein [Pseudomonadota bacterium]